MEVKSKMREKIRLNSSAGTGHFYTTTKNKKTMPEKMEIKKIRPRSSSSRSLQRRKDKVKESNLIDPVISFEMF